MKEKLANPNMEGQGMEKKDFEEGNQEKDSQEHRQALLKLLRQHATEQGAPLERKGLRGGGQGPGRLRLRRRLLQGGGTAGRLGFQGAQGPQRRFNNPERSPLQRERLERKAALLESLLQETLMELEKLQTVEEGESKK